MPEVRMDVKKIDLEVKRMIFDVEEGHRHLDRQGQPIEL